jgi:hypothetical protein
MADDSFQTARQVMAFLARAVLNAIEADDAETNAPAPVQQDADDTALDYSVDRLLAAGGDEHMLYQYRINLRKVQGEIEDLIRGKFACHTVSEFCRLLDTKVHPLILEHKEVDDPRFAEYTELVVKTYDRNCLSRETIMDYYRHGVGRSDISTTKLRCLLGGLPEVADDFRKLAKHRV